MARLGAIALHKSWPSVRRNKGPIFVTGIRTASLDKKATKRKISFGCRDNKMGKLFLSRDKEFVLTPRLTNNRMIWYAASDPRIVSIPGVFRNTLRASYLRKFNSYGGFDPINNRTRIRSRISSSDCGVPTLRWLDAVTVTLLLVLSCSLFGNCFRGCIKAMLGDTMSISHISLADNPYSIMTLTISTILLWLLQSGRNGVQSHDSSSASSTSAVVVLSWFGFEVVVVVVVAVANVSCSRRSRCCFHRWLRYFTYDRIRWTCARDRASRSMVAPTASAASRAAPGSNAAMAVHSYCAIQADTSGASYISTATLLLMLLLLLLFVSISTDETMEVVSAGGWKASAAETFGSWLVVRNNNTDSMLFLLILLLHMSSFAFFNNNVWVVFKNRNRSESTRGGLRLRWRWWWRRRLLASVVVVVVVSDASTWVENNRSNDNDDGDDCETAWRGEERNGERAVSEFHRQPTTIPTLDTYQQ